MTEAATPETGPADAPASIANMDSVLDELAQDTSQPSESDAVDAAVKEMTEQGGEGEAEAPQAEQGEVEAPEGEAEEPEESPPEDTNEPDPAARYTVKVNGEDQKVSFQELKAGYSRTEDYKAKTMALADDKRALETERGGFEAKYADQLKQATDLFVATDPILAEAQNIDWQALAQNDPATYTQLKAAYDARLGILQKARGEIERVAQDQAQAQQKTIEEGLQATEQAIRASDPAFADDARFTTYVKDSVTTLQGVGLDGDDIMAIMSNRESGPGILALVSDAMKYREQQKVRATLPEKRVVKAPAKPLKSDADGSQTTRKALSANASFDAKRDWVVQELLESQGT